MTEREQLEQAIAALEAQRALLGDAVVDTMLKPARDRLAALVAEQAAREQRKLATVLFADVSGFTALSETLDAEDVADLMNRLWSRLDRVVLDHGGVIDKHIGDAVMAVWGVRAAREDDPERAVRAALAMQAQVQGFRLQVAGSASDLQPATFNLQLRMRIGINTGLVMLGAVGMTGEYTAMGDAVNLASRLEHAAPVDGILISHDTYRHVRGVFDVVALEPIRVKGKAEPVPVYVVRRVKPRAFYMPRRGIEGVETRLIGRDAELEALRAAQRQVMATGGPHVVTVLGEAGVGKTRLLEEFEHWLDVQPTPVWYFKGRADEATSRLPFALVRDLLAFRFQIQDSDPLDAARAKLEQGLLAFLDPAASAAPAPPLTPADEPEPGAGPSSSPFTTNGEPEPGAGSSSSLLSHLGRGVGGEGMSALEKAHFIGHLLGFDYSDSPYLAATGGDAAQMRDRAFFHLAQFFRAVTTADGRPPTADLVPPAEPSVVSGPRPAVVLLEDIHWADDGSLDLLAYLAREMTQAPLIEGRETPAPVLMVALARPDLMERRPTWGDGPAPHTRLDLTPLDADQGRALVDALLAKVVDAPAELRDTVANAAEGNPFYAEELVKMLIEAGVIVVGPDRWTANLARLQTLRVPPTLTGVLQARLDALTPEARETLKRASVVGQVFWDAVVAALSQAGGTAVEGSLATLRGKEMVLGRDASQFEGTREFAFKHALLRDVAYETVLLRQRRPYHAQAARWLIERSAERADEYAALIAEHFDRAGAVDQAATWYARAGRQAQAVYANADAIALYRRALVLTADRPPPPPAAPPSTFNLQPSTIDLRLALGEVLELTGAWADAMAQYDAALDLAEASGDLAAQARCHQARADVLALQGDYPAALAALDQARVRLDGLGDERALIGLLGRVGKVREAQGELVQARAVLEESLALAERVGDRRGAAEALTRLGSMEWQQKYGAMARQPLERAVAIWREVGDRGGLLRCLGWLGHVMAFGQGDVVAARAAVEEALALAREMGDRHGTAMAQHDLANLEFLPGGDVERARQAYLRGLAVHRELGNKPGIVVSLYTLGEAAAVLGEWDEAWRYYGESAAAARELGMKARLAYALGRLGELALLREDYAAAQALDEESLALLRDARADVPAAQTLCDLALDVVGLGDPARARELLVEGVTLLSNVGSRDDQLYALISLAVLAQAEGRAERAIRLGAFLYSLPEDRRPGGSTMHAIMDRAVAAARAQLDPAVAAAAEAAGQALTVEQALAEVLGDDAPAVDTP